MKRIQIVGVLFFSLLILKGCDQLKSDDEKIREVLIGKNYEEDRVEDNGQKIKDIRGEFFKDSRFISQATFEITDYKTFTTNDITIELEGDWKVKDRFIYLTYDFDRIKIIPDYFTVLLKDEMIDIIKTKNTPDKVIDYDAAKIIYEDSDGKRYTMKKSY